MICLIALMVVSYLDSTSNHNLSFSSASLTCVVSYLDSTSNHNSIRSGKRHHRLYFIWILHQTTTFCFCVSALTLLYFIWILHQTTTSGWTYRASWSCILFGFYIKPQRIGADVFKGLVVFYLDSTSNHNNYILWDGNTQVVFYLDSTSNHNLVEYNATLKALYFIWILHQTTTS